MIDELLALINDFPGAPNRTRCFNHVIALVAARLVWQFDVSTEGDMETMDVAERELQELAEGIDIEETLTQREREDNSDDDDDNLIDMEWDESDEDTKPI
jgi:hypothetical protein